MQSKEEEHLRRRRYEQKKFTMRLPIEGIRVNTEILNSLAREVRNMRRELSFEHESKR
jgi:HAMP domain-containing protein